MLRPLGAQPLALIPVNLPVFESQINANRSPPGPFIIGSTRLSTAFAAMAASTAEPPRAKICAPAWDASGCAVATMPRLLITMERACERSCAVERAGKDMRMNQSAGLSTRNYFTRTNCEVARQRNLVGDERG